MEELAVPGKEVGAVRVPQIRMEVIMEAERLGVFVRVLLLARLQMMNTNWQLVPIHSKRFQAQLVALKRGIVQAFLRAQVKQFRHFQRYRTAVRNRQALACVDRRCF